MTYEEIRKANEALQTTDVQGRPYVEVNQRIKAFRMVYPDGFIMDELISLENGVAMFKASVGYYAENGEPRILGTGYAYEKEGSTFINKTSFIENGDTSAIGRALGMAGFGIDASVASAEEVQNAIANQGDRKPTEKKNASQEAAGGSQERKASEAQLKIIRATYKGANLNKLLEKNGLEKLEDMTMRKASELIGKLNAKKGA